MSELLHLGISHEVVEKDGVNRDVFDLSTVPFELLLSLAKECKLEYNMQAARLMAAEFRPIRAQAHEDHLKYAKAKGIPPTQQFIDFPV